MDKFNLAICLMTCEIDHLEEWYLHHKEIGFKNFFVYIDSNMTNKEKINKNLVSEIKNLKFIKSTALPITFQYDLYTYNCRKYTNFDYILFIDSDEFYQSVTNNIHEDLDYLHNKYGHFDGLGLYWRLYGSNPPFKNRVPISSYKQWHPWPEIKSLLNPKMVRHFVNPHVAALKTGAKNIDEKGRSIEETEPNRVLDDLKIHTSDRMWIKHVFTRSKAEWEKKLQRKGWYEYFYGLPDKSRTLDAFYRYNQNCVKNDN